MATQSWWARVVVLLLVVVAALVVRNQVKVSRNRAAARAEAARLAEVRSKLFEALRPVALSTCELERFGEANDGGYLLCANLLQGAKAGYSYGISGYDQWGCDVSTRLSVPVHQYDCFNTTVPLCGAGRTVFHAECVAPSAKVEDGWPFDSVTTQLMKNGDGANHVVMKMDVEGAEWDSLLATPDEVLQRIDQLTIELHGVDDPRYIAVVERLREVFHVAHIHFNNFSCQDGVEPFPSWAYEVLFVNKRLDTAVPSRAAGGLLPIDAPNNAAWVDCQSVPSK